MSEAVADAIMAVLPPLLQSLEALRFIARHGRSPEPKPNETASAPSTSSGRTPTLAATITNGA